MSDLIDRQAAIDWIKIFLEQSEDDEHDKIWNDAIRGAINAIKHHVPSAQPEPCEDAVSRSEIIRLILERGLYCDTQADREISAEIIRQLPSVKPERHGQWVVLGEQIEKQTFDECKCSECGCVEYFNKGWKRFNYCPNCGAEMERSEE